MIEFIRAWAELFALAMLVVCGLAAWHHLARTAAAAEWLAEACWTDALNLPPPGHVGRRRAARGYVVRVRDESR